MILDTDTCNLCFSEPNKDLPPSSLDFLKVTLSFLLLVVIVETPLSIGSSSLMSSNVRYSENGLDWVRDDENIGIELSLNDWDSKMMAYPCVLTISGKTYLFYNGNNYADIAE